MYHVPDFIRFICQGKMDSYSHMHYKFIGCMLAILAIEKRMVNLFQIIKWNATKDILLHEQRLDYLKSNAKKENTGKINMRQNICLQ